MGLLAIGRAPDGNPVIPSGPAPFDEHAASMQAIQARFHMVWICSFGRPGGSGLLTMCYWLIAAAKGSEKLP
ncbi:MAG: hypothetical protein WCD03_14820, partial [Candidatus Cybelea sp.]